MRTREPQHPREPDRTLADPGPGHATQRLTAVTETRSVEDLVRALQVEMALRSQAEARSRDLERQMEALREEWGEQPRRSLLRRRRGFRRS